MTYTIKNSFGHIKITNEWIHSFVVKPKYRNKGYGSKLLDMAIHCGGNKLFVHKDNKRAIRLYERFGFKYFSNDERKGYIDMVLRKNKNEIYC